MNAKRTVKPLWVLITVLATGGFLASSMAVHAMDAAPEIHGRLSVKLSEKFALTLPNGTTGVAWSPDSSTLAVSSNYGMNLNTFDNAGHRLSEFHANGNKGAYVNSFAFINGSSRVLFPVENNAPIDAAFDIRDTATGHVVKGITRGQARIIANYFAVSSDQKRFAIANNYGKEVVTYAADNDTDWRELSTARASPINYEGLIKEAL